MGNLNTETAFRSSCVLSNCWSLGSYHDNHTQGCFSIVDVASCLRFQCPGHSDKTIYIPPTGQHGRLRCLMFVYARGKGQVEGCGELGRE